MEEKAIKTKEPRKPKTPSKIDSAVLNATLDHLIIELLKKNPTGLCSNEIKRKLEGHPDLDPEIDYRTRINTRLNYLVQLGDRTGLFKLKCEVKNENSNEADDAKKEKIYKYINIIPDSEIQLLLRANRSIKGKPLEKDPEANNTDDNKIKKRLLRSPRRFFASLTSESFIETFDNEDAPELRNKDMLDNIRIIKEAISNNHTLAFRYGDYNIDKELCPRKDENGTVIVFKVYPLKMVVSLGRLYLYCSPKNSKNPKLISKRVDRIISCSENKKEEFDRKGLSESLLGNSTEPHFAQRLYMFTGKAYRIKFLTDEQHLDDVFDWFGSNVELKKAKDNMIEVTVRANKDAMLCWAMQYCKFVKVIYPEDLVEKIKKTLDETMQKYQ